MQQYTYNEEIVFVDTEVSKQDEKVRDIGAVRTTVPVLSTNGLQLHSSDLLEFEKFIKGATYICGHNIINFDLKYIMSHVERAEVRSVIDTLYLSPLLFPMKPYHKLLKDDKIQSDELNNPLNDSIKAMELLMDEVTAFELLSNNLKKIYCTLLSKVPEFRGFFRYTNYNDVTNYLSTFIEVEFKGKICANADVNAIASIYPVELAYCLATISTDDKESIIPYWVQKNYPKVQEVYTLLRGVPCKEGCPYCKGTFDIYAQLKRKFGYDEYRKYNGEPLQEKAVQAAVDGKSLLAIFPTGGGKSITFQIPALIAAEATHGLTVVISPLQSLMKDQVDNLSERGITDAVTVNGLLNIVERAEALERVENGIASILYISPESLRSKTIERLLLGRNVIRFVIDEAHCFSAWGQDFRVDYLYIGDFIKTFQEKKNTKIPVSCFTATAKQKVISDIKEYFKQKLDINLELYTTNAARTNLRYEVLYRENDVDKYATLRSLIEQKNCPTIVYASRTKNTIELAKKLCGDGFNARAFNGKMERDEKIANQEAFIKGDVQIIVATSAFGMGVDKKDVKLVVHYDISDSLENYVQEAGRAGRDQSIQAECYVLFNEEDLDKHFILLNQTKLSINEIQQTWKAIKDMTKDRRWINCSALEIARKAGWDDTSNDIETKVKTAILALENAGYIKRGQNSPRVFADSICVKNAQEAVERINSSAKFDEQQKEYAVRIIKKLISTRSKAKAGNDEAESRVDYIADHLAIPKGTVIEVVDIMKDVGILANDKEMYAYVDKTAMRGRAKNSTLNRFSTLEGFLVSKLKDEGIRINYKEVNEEAINSGVTQSTVNNLRMLLYFWIIKGYIKKPEGELNSGMQLDLLDTVEQLKCRYEKRVRLSKFIEEYFIKKASEKESVEEHKNSTMISFSMIDIKNAYNSVPKLLYNEEVTLGEVSEALLYLSKINAFRLEGGFLVLYNAMSIERIELDNKIRYKVEDYKQLQEHYDLKTQQIHIVGEFANMMVRDYDAALTFVNDYFGMEYKLFLTKYFEGSRMSEIARNITPMKYHMLFENLSKRQAEIIEDDTSGAIVVAAGPGSGKTKILVHKLASLMLLEDVKHEQLLLLTFSRAAAMEFKMRLIELIGNAAHFVEIKTFHSYCFDLLGKIGNIENSKNVVKDATDMILNGEVELDRITKTVLVIDEAQDMDVNEYNLVRALMERNEDMRVIAVGDDDQNIYEFRGSDSKYMGALLNAPGAKMYELLQNYRSSKRIVWTANTFAKLISNRMKQNEIMSVKQDVGEVQIIRNGTSLEMAAINRLELARRNVGTVSGRTVAILTTTNEQAYLVMELLNKKGYKARLLQSNDSFSLYDLAEIRYFVNTLKAINVPVITDEKWEEAKYKLQCVYAESDNLESCMYMLEQFERTTAKKYFTDLESFFKEARFEDFYKADKDEICVSTIHKSKGREFDDVYMLVSQGQKFDDTRKRSIYVGMTRAKNNLYVFHNSDYFDAISAKLNTIGVQFLQDNTRYPEPEEIVMAMSHRDVNLGFFTEGKRSDNVSELRAGCKLDIKESSSGKYYRLYFSVMKEGKLSNVACCSSGFAEKLQAQRQKGYVPYLAKVNYVVKWWNKEDEKEYTIVLPIIKLRKSR
ncbi:MAG: RecQ family ATP-dependent DNA helicase [Lachnospira sp.]|nr:RecQ family ATP-dependent DNA helicase [Lachnospira sp.]